MITPAYCRMMAAYNLWQNESLVAAADAIGAGARAAERGAFFGSIEKTFAHLLWGDTIWMSRFDGWEKPSVSIAESVSFVTDWAAFQAARAAADARISDWAAGLAPGDVTGELAWYSGALGHDVARPRALCLVHFFNHQTHHRGQLHAMLTAAGAAPDDTDLFILPGAARFGADL